VTSRGRRGLAIARWVVALLVAATCWPLLAPAYDGAVTRTAIAVLRRLPSSAEARAWRDGESTIVESAPPGTGIAPQQLELSTHHNNLPFLAVMLAFASTLPWTIRIRRLAAGLAILAVTHVGQFVLYVHADRAILNEPPYRVTDLHLLDARWSERMRDPVQRHKEIVLAAYRFQAHVGHVLIPVLLWLVLAAPMAVVAKHGEADDADGRT